MAPVRGFPHSGAHGIGIGIVRSEIERMQSPQIHPLADMFVNLPTFLIQVPTVQPDQLRRQ